MEKVSAFDYSPNAHGRRHGPKGYCDYESFRDWLRDEFSFRCVFCLKREVWGIRQGSFHLDHFRPQKQNPSGILEYDNLLYVCATCNSLKGDLPIPDPCQIPFGQCLRVHEDGRIEALRQEGQLLIDLLRLDNGDHTHFRRRILEMLRFFIHHNGWDLYVDWMRYPEDLPDLNRKRAPENARPEGIEQSCHARRCRGELSEVY